MDEHSMELQNSLDEAFIKADDRGEVVWVRNLSEEEKVEWENRALNDNNVIEIFKGEDVIAYQIIKEQDEANDQDHE